MSTNYSQLKPLTDEERTKVYLKLPKKEIIEMLISCNKALDAAAKIVTYDKPFNS